MDPLSVTTGVIAVVGAVEQAAKCIQKLRAIRQAPREVSLLLEEVADLREVLQQVETAQRPPEYRERAVPFDEEKPAKGLDRLIRRTSAKLEELDSLLQHHGSRTQRRTPDWSWLRGKKKADALRSDLTTLRMNITAVLSGITSKTANRIESAIDKFNADNAEQVKATKVLTSLVRSVGVELPSSDSSDIKIDRSRCDLSFTIQYPVQTKETSCSTSTELQREASKMTRHISGALKQNKSPAISRPMQIHSQKGTAACQTWCSCACHAKTVLRTTRRNGLGSLSISYSGLPWVTPQCDQKACRSRSLPTVALTIRFPSWFWTRNLSPSFAYSPLEGPYVNYLQFPRTVSWVSSLWRHGLDGNIPAIQDLFSRGLASPNDVQGLGGSVLHYAADHGHWHLCKFLIGEGARLDDEDDFHNTPTSLAWEKILSGALTENEASMVASMFANTDFLQTRQFSVLHKIVLHLIPRTIESELDYTTRDLNAVDSSGRTALVWAAARGDELALRTLINYGADVNLPDGQGNTPLHHARTVECIDKLLHAGADTLARNTFGQTPLHMVCRGTGSLPVLKRLMTADIDIDATDNSGETFLHNATFNKHVECAFHLVHSGADINIANNAKDAPIHMALMSDVPATLLLLLNHGAEYQQATHNGRTILHYAAGLVCAETVDILKNHGLPGIDVDARDLDGKTVEDILEERADDDDDPLFKSRFRDMLDSVRNAQGAKQTVIPDLPELTMEIKGSLGVIKDNPVVHVTPVSSDEDEDEDVHDYENDTHGAPVFFDAVEEIQQGVQVIEIAA
ncbi:MAG: hypothetical protein Q9223_000138 [Gallowayella weberi]